MPNLLANETSPYLLQHADNPVDWMPWGPEAFAKARDEDKPIFLSIGYAACHWCHVMAHESFEDAEIAALLNQHFVSIKVDREERPDVDSVYMNAVVTMTGQGGWPMSVFLTPEGEPFYGGTYFPPVRRYNMPAFSEVLLAAANAWRDDRGEIRKSSQQLAEHISAYSAWSGSPGDAIRENLLEQATHSLLNSYDWQHGGWGQAPRFPQPMSLEFLLLQSIRGNPKALDSVRHNLLAMCRGGMYDVVGGGFARYSTDDRWLAPHFEKMLYDNAQLALIYLHAGLYTAVPTFISVCTRTLDFIKRELTHPQGGIFSSLDADSEGQEGKFYVWTLAELREILEPEALFDFFQQVYDLPARGNFEGHIILQQRADLPDIAGVLSIPIEHVTEKLSRCHNLLLERRSMRIRPATDDKVLVSWNALALRAYAEAARYLRNEDYLIIARRIADFILKNLVQEGVLYRSWRNGVARQPGFLEDYAGLIIALLALYQSDPDLRWYRAALELTEKMLDRFRDPAGGFYDTPRGSNDLIIRPKDYQDNATPCGNSLAALALAWMAQYSESQAYQAYVMPAMITLQDAMVRHPTAFGHWLQAVDFITGPVRQVALISQTAGEQEPFKTTLWEKYRTRLVFASATLPLEGGSPELLHNRPLKDHRTTAYVCENYTCKLPVNDPAEMAAQMI